MLLTIFTPTYNRAYILEKLYHSLCNQSEKSFVWLIVDDGSTDNTKDLVKIWQQRDIIKIEYIYQKNQGKHVAHNLASEICNTKLFVCVDSDDILTSNAVACILDYDMREVKEDIVGYCSRRGDFSGKLRCCNWNKNLKYCSFFDLYEKYKFRGETMLIWKTDVLKKYKFPVFSDERFCTESVLYYQVSYKDSMRLIDEILYLFDYQEDGYTRQGNKLFLRNPKGYAVYLLQMANLCKSMKKIRWLARYYGWVKAFGLEQKMGKWIIPNEIFLVIFSKIYSVYYKKKYSQMIIGI